MKILENAEDNLQVVKITQWRHQHCRLTAWGKMHPALDASSLVEVHPLLIPACPSHLHQAAPSTVDNLLAVRTGRALTDSQTINGAACTPSAALAVSNMHANPHLGPQRDPGPCCCAGRVSRTATLATRTAGDSGCHSGWCCRRRPSGCQYACPPLVPAPTRRGTEQSPWHPCPPRAGFPDCCWYHQSFRRRPG